MQLIIASGSGLSPSVASTSTENGISCLEAISPIPQVRKPEPSRRKKQTAEILTASEKRETMREKPEKSRKRREKAKELKGNLRNTRRKRDV
jgi:hypothetical protein